MEIGEIKYMLKPDWVSWEQIKECMFKAHEPNRKKGIVMQNQFMTIEEFEKYYKDAICVVAIKDKTVIGTSSYKIIKRNNWWANNKPVAYEFGDAIIPEYRGTDVYFDLLAFRAKHIADAGIRILQFDTAENNQLVQKLSIKKGAKRVKLYASKKTWYYSVMMVKWLDGCPHSDWYCNFRFNLSCFIVKTIFKPGRKLRFWFN